MIPSKIEIIIAIFCLLLGLLMGYKIFRSTEIVYKEQIKTVEVEKQVENKDIHQKTIIVKEHGPDGTEKTTTTISLDDTSKIIQDKSVNTITNIEKVNQKPIVNLAALFVVSNRTLYYGASISKEVAGPITAGIFILTNGVAGVTLGIDLK
jgi:hypothetical protein